MPPRGGVSFFSSYPLLWVVLARAAARPTAGRRLVRECILGNVLRVFIVEYGSESTSESSSSGEMEVKSNWGACLQSRLDCRLEAGLALKELGT